tara:strand:- start:49 stop:429 length:381 start_codon:yes stop_codon:yes gene_type:complete
VRENSKTSRRDIGSQAKEEDREDPILEEAWMDFYKQAIKGKANAILKAMKESKSDEVRDIAKKIRDQMDSILHKRDGRETTKLKGGSEAQYIMFFTLFLFMILLWARARACLIGLAIIFINEHWDQ